MVTKGQLRDARHGGARSRAALSAPTRAATGCGTCRDDLAATACWPRDTDPSRTELSQAEPGPAGAGRAVAADGPASEQGMQAAADSAVGHERKEAALR